MAFLSENERHLRANAASSSITSVRLEDLEPTAQLTRDLERWTEGDLTLDEVRDRLFARFAKEDQDAGGR